MRVSVFFTFLTIAVSATAGKSPPHQLGPTGLVGSVSKNTAKITAVLKGSPADGKVKKGDQLIGANGKKFAKDARKELAAAIDQAETEASGGKLTLMLKGNKTATLQLQVLGSYSKTFPYECPKSNAIITRAAESLLKNGKIGSDRLRLSALALMATGEKKYQNAAYKAIRNADWTKRDQTYFDGILSGETGEGYTGWDWSYALIALSEYHLQSGDESVLPTIRNYALALARGQDGGGLWGHRMAKESRNGRLPGYAQINQTSLTCFMGILLAKKCGVQDEQLQAAIEKTNAFYSSYVGRGAFPYGVHGPNSKDWNNNGTSATGALCMAFADNSEGARFFSQLSATAYDTLESGHASTFFNPLWTPLGANLSGPRVTHEFFKRSLWLQTMYRSWHGGFSRYEKNGKEGPQTASALLAYCLPRRALYVTGKEADKSIWLKGNEAVAAVELSKIDYKKKSTAELLELVNHPYAQVRRRANWELNGKRDELTPTYVKWMTSGTPYQKDAALGTFGYWAPKDKRLAQLDNLGKILRDTNETAEARATAAGSLAFIGEPAYKYFGDVVGLLTENRPNDRFGEIDASLGKSIVTLCADPFKAGLVKDKAQYYKAALKLIRNKRQGPRADGAKMLAGMPMTDFHIVADDLLHLIEDKDSTYHSYHNPSGPIGGAIAVLANLNIKEGMQYALAIHDNPSGKGSFKMHACWAALAKYGGNAKPALEQLRKKYEGRTDFGRHTGKYKAMVKAIEGDKSPKPLITLAEARKK
jgi:hypothetical protein